MKRMKPSRTKRSSDSDQQTDCLCQVYCADDLQRVSSRDCSCSDCAEVRKEVYSQYFQEAATAISKRKAPHMKPRPKLTQIKYGGLGEQDLRKGKKDKTKSTFGRSPRVDSIKSKVQEHNNTSSRRRERRKKHRGKYYKSFAQQEDSEDLPQRQPEEINIVLTKYDYNEAQMLYYVDQRIKQNLNKRRHAEKDTKMPKQSRSKRPWNYNLQKQQSIEREEHCHRILQKAETNTGLNRQYVQSTISLRIKKRKEQQRLQREQAKLRSQSRPRKKDGANLANLSFEV